jgi:hypothetical protein
MSEFTDFYMSWLGGNLFGTTSAGLSAPIPIPFSPTDLSDCLVWFDATDNLTITADFSNNVTSWYNKGDLSGSMVPYLTEAVPTTNTHTINGNNAVWFDQYQTLYQNMAFPNEAYTLLVVTNILVDPAVQNYADWFGALTAGGFGASLSEYLGNYYVGCGGNAIDNYVMNMDATTITNTPLIYAIRSSSDISGNIITRNGVSLDLNAANQFLGYNTSPLDFYIHFYTHPSSIDVGELIVYNRAIENDELLTVTQYLANKFSITL